MLDNNPTTESAERPNFKPVIKPSRAMKTGLPKAANEVKMRVIKLSVTNILLLVGAVVALLILINSASQPSLGQQVSLDTFLNNLKDSKYAEVKIRNDGNAVAYGKDISVVQITAANPVQLEQKVAELSTPDNMEEKNLDDLIKILKAPTNISEFFQRLGDSLSANRINQIMILDTRIVVDWEKKDHKDWVLSNVQEKNFVSALVANNIDISALPYKVVYLRDNGVIEEKANFLTAYQNARYTKIWQFNDRVYALAASQNVLQNYVSFSTATADFTKFLQQEGINLSSQNVNFNVLPINQIDMVSVINIAFILMLAGLGYMLLRSINSSNGGLMKFGQSRARMFFGQKIDISFKDVAGVDEAKEELKEVVDFLKNPEKYLKLGAKIPRGVLMVGEPGTGKTLLARAVAGEAGVPFFHTSGSEFEEMLVGAGASRVRDLFDKAKKASPSLIFIDEIDAVGRKRGTTIQSSSTEQTLNQILVEMDGFEQRDNVIVLAATNRPDVLDPALLRPGRFDRKVILDSPDINGRRDILVIHAANKPLAAEVDLLKVSKRTVGFSGADLANMLNEAAIIVAKDGRKEITEADIEEAATKVQTGPIRKRNRTEEELKMTAYHEAAHAVIMYLTPQHDPVHRITILSRGMALGYTMPLPETDQLQMTKTKMESHIRSLLAGWIAEELVFGDVTTGASNDIEKATSIAQRMIKQFGMSKKLGLVKYGNQEDEPRMGWGFAGTGYSESTAQTIDEEVRRIIQDAFDDAKRLLVDHRDKLDELAELLLKNEVVEGDEFKLLMGR